MATKAENIVTLVALAEKLGRQVDTTGTAAEVAQRVAEWQEEADGLDGTGTEPVDDGEPVGTDSESAQQPAAISPSEHDGMVLVKLLMSVHLAGAYAADGVTKVDIGTAGQQVRIPESLVEPLHREKVIA
ncbi:hypothetical protein GTGU_01228 [Trabulsiella guamensis ATCC 49490]|uniref:DNA packaging protein n=1 Tax=Trabulsiella guamensis ATCC 49490 TaxID=1005994 RepID=A0A085AFP1_9ENTR|nr:DNA-packaging protein FI [Trabulsiella guamensis]KFC09036.1 hypothetical protein GTGU_01228 [Trabulsiella guamensis ATCC 49490]